MFNNSLIELLIMFDFYKYKNDTCTKKISNNEKYSNDVEKNTLNDIKKKSLDKKFKKELLPNGVNFIR
jgi:uncharacterized Fe-S radical SAM superfamily protein PflX